MADLPEHKRATPSDSISPTLLAWICMLASAGALGTWYLDHSQGMTTPWETAGAPAIGLICGLTSLLLFWRPAWLDALMVGLLMATGVYFLGCLHYASLDATGKGLYTLASNAQFMPLLYVGAFVSIRRGAATLSWVHYGGLVLLYVLYCLRAQPGQYLPVANDMIGHTWFVLLLTHPCYIVALQYITTLKGRLRQSERDAQASKERFLAMLSHEIRSPLQAMLGSIDLLGLKVQTPPERRAVDRLRQSAAQLDAHLRDVTEYTRLENPSWQLQIDTVDLAALVRDVCDTYQPQAAAKGLRIYCETPPDQDLSLQAVLTDARRVRQILSNLITNAIKYTPHGHVGVQVSNQPSSGSFLLQVSDTGIGIPPDEQGRIFEPYVRLEDRRTAGAEGSGLGLAVVQRLVDRLGGTLQLNSQIDIGSTFKVTLPMQARQ
jgi:signal transduction histidine kinase